MTGPDSAQSVMDPLITSAETLPHESTKTTTIAAAADLTPFIAFLLVYKNHSILREREGALRKCNESPLPFEA
jgi:hypothetical protein